ncbi:ATP-binding protein [Scatolibacter rhodanostii]|uniref:ATP-binding protein n=1 Tax=Scatolibacter rhodanostii TaxID=2014781 RepID=UPI001FA83D18|nr:ATP-binding protein [Scatolibacter rhodanostii]
MQNFSNGLHSLAVFRGLLTNPVMAKLLQYLDTDEYHLTTKLDAYSDFVSELYKNGCDLGHYLYAKVMESENPAVIEKAEGKNLSVALQKSLEQELALFTAISSLSPVEMAPLQEGHFPEFENTKHDFGAEYTKRLQEIHTRGYGIFTQYHMFTLSDSGQLLPVEHPEEKKLSDLTGYEREREQITINTEALLKNLPSNNILLYGDAGTGKSCTVKVLVNEYQEQGLRLIEIRKNQLYLIPALMDRLAKNPLKFILFIDDLSFSSADQNFTDLKAILEGTVAARPKNIVIYATSNRRHMVKQSFSERQGDDVHVGDTVEESASLSARFGLTITFLRPDKDLYAEIVEHLAVQNSIQLAGTALLQAAEAHASRQGGRSPRVARQFVEYQKAKEITKISK